MKRRHGRYTTAWLAFAAAMLSQGAGATEMVYQPLNPSFGGNPLYGSYLLNSALATNKHKDPDIEDSSSGFEQKSPLETFNDTLERAILSRLATAASSKIIGSNGQFIPGRLETDNFTIDVADLGGGVLSITTIDKVTGAVTTFQVSQ
jgi:curli production assembly/transport component CsgF